MSCGEASMLWPIYLVFTRLQINFHISLSIYSSVFLRMPNDKACAILFSCDNCNYHFRHIVKCEVWTLNAMNACYLRPGFGDDAVAVINVSNAICMWSEPSFIENEFDIFSFFYYLGSRLLSHFHEIKQKNHLNHVHFISKWLSLRLALTYVINFMYLFDRIVTMCVCDVRV